MLRAVQEAVDHVNRTEGGIRGRHLSLRVFDDRNSPEVAREVAGKIAADPAVVAVIGHRYSGASLAAAPLYAAARLPAVTPTSTNPAVTEGNEWYFRTIYDDKVQGRFLSRYARNILKASRIAIVSGSGAYASTLQSIIAAESSSLGLTVSYRWQGAEGGDPAQAAASESAMIQALSRLPADTLIMLMADQKTGVRLVRSVRDAGIRLPLLLPDALGSAEVAETLSGLPKEKLTPGFYTGNVHVSVPFMAEAANAEGRDLMQRLSQKGDGAVFWGAAYAYDAAQVIIEALRRAGPAGDGDMRTAIRDQMALMNGAGLGVHGATGITWFNERRAANKPVVLGNFSGGLNCSLMQLHYGRKDDDSLEAVPLVYSGIVPGQISLVPHDRSMVDVDFDIWFRYQGELPVSDLVFSGAVGPVELGKPVESVEQDGVNYRLYRAHGRFLVNDLGGRAAKGESGVLLSWHHHSAGSRLILVVDRLGLPALSGPGLVSWLSPQTRLPPGLRIARASLTTETIVSSSLGNPLLTREGDSSVSQAGLVLSLDLAPEVPGLRRLWLEQPVELPTLVVVLLFVLLLILEDRKPLSSSPRLMLLALSGVAVLDLLLSENVLIRQLLAFSLEPWVYRVILVFDALWWLAPACLLILAVERMIWVPLSRTSGRPVPRVVKIFFNSVIILLTAFGIISNVLDYDVTGLMATSGLFAMIIGLAVQSNLSNIFSGIALNVERPMRPGDWVKIGGSPLSRVVDISWRATRVKTKDNTALVIPNSVVAGSSIENFSFPQGVINVSQVIYIDPHHDPRWIQGLLGDAMGLVRPVDGRSQLGVAAVSYRGVDERGAMFILSFDCADGSLAGRQTSVVMLEVEKILRIAGVSLITGRSEVVAHSQAGEEPVSLSALLRRSPLFAALSDEDLGRIAAAAVRRPVEAGTRLALQGERGEVVSLVARGVIVATHRDNGAVPAPAGGEQAAGAEVFRLGPGDLVGETALPELSLPSPVTLEALRKAVLYELPRAMLQQMMEESPAFGRAVSALIQQRRDAREELVARQDGGEPQAVLLRPGLMTVLRRAMGGRRQAAQ